VRGSGRSGITLHLDLEPVEVPVEKAPPVALMMNELITNALKHAFPDNRPGRLSITVRPDGRHFAIRIADDGVGMPHDIVGARSFGKRLIESLARQLTANIAWKPNHPGTSIDIRLPRESSGAKAGP
jgi:two-component sensor histidine kinase